MLEKMMEFDDLSGALKIAEAALASEQKQVQDERQAISAEHDQLRARVEELKQERSAVVAGLSAAALSTFDLVSRRRHGVAMAEARDGICTICHVRLRPQVFNDVRRNDSIIQCESCTRILYFVPSAASGAAPQPS
jgi:predicted  nucleic acid-binding Zn-ribbon protein